MEFNRTGFALILLLIFLSRLPFVNAGFGGEEDAWGLALTAKRIAETGHYEVSRLPGHPLQEFIYAAISNRPAVVFNLITAFLSTVAAGVFMLILVRLNIPAWLPAGLAFAFTPVVYINSTNAMDYLWTQAFVFTAFYFLLRMQPRWCGLMIGLAAGCRITALAMLLPFAYWLFDPANRKDSFRAMASMIFTASVVFLVVYFPVYSTYGISFFDYTARIPAPLDKALYRATAGTWGIIGSIDLAALLAMGFYRRNQAGAGFFTPSRQQKLIVFALLVIGIYTLAFVMLPHKAAFFIPVVPFVLLLICIWFPSPFITAFSFSLILSSFFVSINLDNPERSATPSAWSLKTEVSGRPVVIDFLRGPVMAEHSKRINKMEVSKKRAAAILALQHPSVIIAGFWMNDIMFQTGKLPEHIRMVYYEPEDSLRLWTQQQLDVFFLPEQDYFNDLCYRGKFTAKYARKLD